MNEDVNIYRCPNCHQILIKDNNTYKCQNRHSFDISRFGYVNLLLANQHSQNSGDNKEMILARVEFFKKDKYHLLKETLASIIDSLAKEEVMFADVACGEGYYTNYIHNILSKKHKVKTIGVDISKYGIIECSKKVRSEQLANIDYCIGNLANLPFLDKSFDILLNCFAPIDENEFARVLKEKGYYIRVLPDLKHLYELKEVLYKEVHLNEEKDKELVNFDFIKEIKINDMISLDNQDEIISLFKMTPYYYKSSLNAIDSLKKLTCLKTTIAFKILIYQKRI